MSGINFETNSRVQNLYAPKGAHAISSNSGGLFYDAAYVVNAKDTRVKRQYTNSSWRNKVGMDTVNKLDLSSATDSSQVLEKLLKSKGINPSGIDMRRLENDLIENNPSVFSNDGKVYSDAKWAKLDFPKDPIRNYFQGPSASPRAISDMNQRIKRDLTDYNRSRGENLASLARREARGWGDGKCAKHVKTCIARAGLGKYVSGDAYQITDILRKNPNFKEIDPTTIPPNELPAGCILVYDKGVSGYSPKYGHAEITLGDGTAASSGITQNIRRPISHVFIPVNPSNDGTAIA